MLTNYNSFDSLPKAVAQLHEMMDRRLDQIEAELQSLKKEGPTASINNLLDVDEACAFLKMARPTLYAKTSRNEIPHIKRGKKLWFEPERLQEWLIHGYTQEARHTQDNRKRKAVTHRLSKNKR